MIEEFITFIRELCVTCGLRMAIAPLMVGAAALGAASSIGNAIFGGISANKQKRKQLRALHKAQQENRDWYNRRYNEKATERADTQRALSTANEAIAARNRAAAGKKAVIGGTDASLAATQQANAKAVGDALSGIAASAEARKDAIEAQYRDRKQQLEDAEVGVQAASDEAKRAATAQAASGATQAMFAIAAAKEEDENKDPWDKAVRTKY